MRRLIFCLVAAHVHQHQCDAAQWLLRHLGASTPGQLPVVSIEKALDYAIGLAEHGVHLTPQALGDRVRSGDTWLGAALAGEAISSMIQQIAMAAPPSKILPAGAPDNPEAATPTC